MRIINLTFTLCLAIFLLAPHIIRAGEISDELRTTIEELSEKVTRAMLDGDFETVLK